MTQLKRCLFFIILVLCITVAGPTAPVAAQLPGTHHREIPAALAPAAQPARTGVMAVLVELQPGTSQQRIAAELAALGAQELYRVSLVYNGLAIRVDAQQLDAIGAIAGVKAIHPLVAKELLDLLGTSPVSPSGLWEALPTGVTGADVQVGVVDSGIDYTHATFGGAGGFPSARVSGGYDFAGDSYDIVTSPIPMPDADPRDCNGHGTHIAGTVAGSGVRNGVPYNGPYDQPLDLSSFTVAPGVAPQAQLHALKVLGCSSSRKTLLLLPAIERALDPDGDGDSSDHLDVLIISLGTAFGGFDDPDLIAVERAVAAGMVVVVGAGAAGIPADPDVLRDGSAFYAVQSPGSATGAISVAAVDASGGTTPQPGSAATFSNLGPQRHAEAIKPDLAAPGVAVLSAFAGTRSAATTSSGTATAAAHVAGAAALLRQIHPAWSPLQVKAALMNTADPFQDRGESYSLLRSGLGRLNVTRALDTTLLAFAADANGAVGLNFGPAWVASTNTYTFAIAIENTGTTAREVRIQPGAGGAGPGLPDAGVQVSVAPGTRTIPAGASVTATVTLSVTGSALTVTRDPAIPILQAGLPRHYLSEQSGALLITSGSGPASNGIRVPYLLSARSASDATLNSNRLVVPGGTGVALTTVRNTGARNSTSVPTERPLLSAFKLAYSSPDEPGSIGPVNAADLQYVGVASNYAYTGGKIADSRIYLGIAAQRPWSTPNAVRFEVWFDVDEDGVVDYVLANTSLGSVQSATAGGVNDVFLGTLFQNRSATAELDLVPLFSDVLNNLLAPTLPEGQDTALFNSRVLFMSVNAAWLGLHDSSSPGFAYQVRSYHHDAGGFAVAGPVDQTPWLQFDLRQPMIDPINLRNTPGIKNIAGTPLYLSTNGSPIFVRAQGLPLNGSTTDPPGLLVLFHHNRPDQQVQVLPVEAGFVPFFAPLIRI